MDAATVTDTGTAGAVTITDGTEAAVTTNGTTIAAGKVFAGFAFVIPIARAKRELQRRERVAPPRRGRFSDL